MRKSKARYRYSVTSQTQLLRRLGMLFKALFKVRLQSILILVFAAVFIFSATMLILGYVQGESEEKAFRRLSLIAENHAAPTPHPPLDNAPAVPPTYESAFGESEILPQYQELYEQNEDMIGWVKIDGTAIDYPVMYTPGDGDFYLSHGFDKKQTKSGVPFIDKRCPIDPFATNTIIYGHHMKNGTMFAGLEKYKDEEFYIKHPVIRFDTLYKEQQYEIIAVFESKVYKQSDEAFKHYNFLNAETETDFNTYITNIKSHSLYDTGMTVSYGDTLLTLVTCDYHTANGQFVVVAVNKD